MMQTSNFADLPRKYSVLTGAAIVVVPVPYDATSTWQKGSAKGPAAILEASANMELYDLETDFEVYKKGIFTADAVEEKSSPESMVEAVKKTVARYIKDGRFAVVIGGEHSVGIGAVEANVEEHKDITVLQLDAHCDLRDEYNGSKFNHACVMARVRPIAPVVQVGIRSMDSSEKKFIDNNRVFFAKDIYKTRDWIETVAELLTEKVYITIDLDVFDPSIMPSVSTPEPGGLLWYDVLALLKTVADRKQIVGFDVVELCPCENNKAPDFLAAKLIYKLLSYKFAD